MIAFLSTTSCASSGCSNQSEHLTTYYLFLHSPSSSLFYLLVTTWRSGANPSSFLLHSSCAPISTLRLNRSLKLQLLRSVITQYLACYPSYISPLPDYPFASCRHYPSHSTIPPATIATIPLGSMSRSDRRRGGVMVVSVPVPGGGHKPYSVNRDVQRGVPCRGHGPAG